MSERMRYWLSMIFWTFAFVMCGTLDKWIEIIEHVSQ